MVGDIISERWAELSRNGGRLHSGIVGDFGRNPQVDLPKKPWPVLMITLKSRTLGPAAQRFIESSRVVAKKMPLRPALFS
jgi:hypothetical protein